MIDFEYKIVLADPDRDLLVCEFSSPGKPTIKHRVSIAPQDDWTEDKILARIYNTVPLVEAEWKNIEKRATHTNRSGSAWLGRQGTGQWVEAQEERRAPEHHPINEKVEIDHDFPVTNSTPTSDFMTVVPTTEEERTERRAIFRASHKISMRQARLLLAREGKLGQVDAAIQSASEEAQLEWEYSQVVERKSPLVAAMSAVLGWDEETMDEKFIAARDI